MKRFFSLFLIAALLGIPFAARAEEGDPTPKWFTADIQDANTLGVLLAAQLDDSETLASVQYLRLSGTLGSDDITLLKSTLTGLVEVDMSGLTVTTLPESLFVNDSNRHIVLRRVTLPSGLITIGYKAFYNCTNLEEVVAPATLTTIDNYAFYLTTSLTTFDFSSTRLSTIGNYAFYQSGIPAANFPSTLSVISDYAFKYCSRLATLSFPERMTKLGYECFENCYALQSVTLPLVDTMGENIFYYCYGLTEVIIPEGFKTLPSGFLYACSSLTSLDIPASVQTICSYALYNCRSLSEVTLHEGLKEIGYYAFSACEALNSLTLPSTIINIYGNPFYACGIKNLTCKALIPCYVNGALFSTDPPTDCTLRVPQASLSAYMVADGWNKFATYEAFDAEDADKYFPSQINLVKEISYVSPANQPDGWKPQVDLLFGKEAITMGSDYYNTYNFGRLRVLGDDPLHISTLNLTNHYYYYRNYYSNSEDRYNSMFSQLIPRTTVTADNVNMRVYFNTYYYASTSDKWQFISFPFDVDLADHDFVDSGHYYAVYSYDGARRANGENGWVREADDATLRAGQGYIISLSGYDNGTRVDTECVTFHSASSAEDPVTINGEDVVVDLDENPSDYSQNGGWNFIGNPYMSYYDTRFMDFDGPITVRSATLSSTSYQAYSLVDDQKILAPGEAFFVQRSPTAESVTFHKEGQQFSRVARTIAEAPARIKASGSERMLLNLTLTGEAFTDRTRVVLNPEASADYEPGRDAAKFWAEEDALPQISSVIGGVDFAINELSIPAGDIPLRTRTTLPGTYTIALAEPMDYCTVELVDLKTGAVTDLNREACEYEAESGDTDLRFRLRLSPIATAIGAVGASHADADCWYNLQGMRLGTRPVAPGLYIHNGKKVIVK